MASAAAHVDDDNPWPGLDSYSEAAQKWFHGRDSDSAEMLRLIRQSSFVMLYGKSGLGKSSMLKAGVFPALREARFLPVYLRLDYTEGAEQPPLQQALARLLQEAALNGIAAPPAGPGEGLWAYLQRRDRPLWTADNFPLTPVLVFDQFEEVFSRGGSAEHIKKVLDALADLVGDRLTSELMANPEAARRLNLQSQRYRVVLSFRSDFLAEVESWQRSASLPKHEALHLKAMTRATAIDAVAKAGAAVLEPGVAEQIVDFVLERDDAGGRASEVEPVLLSLCCYQLNNRRQRPAKIDSVLLGQVGKDILQDFYGEALSGMPDRVSIFIEDNLIQGGRYRSTFPRAEAIDSGALQPQELETLTQRRLLRVDPQGDVPRIELIHDRLVAIVRDAKDKRLAAARQQAERVQAEKETEERRRQERMLETTRSRNRLRWALGALALVTLGLLFFANDARRETARANLEAASASESAARADVLASLAAEQARQAQDKAEMASRAEAETANYASRLLQQTQELARQKERADAQRELALAAEKSARDSSRRAEALRLVVEGQSMLAGTLEGDDVRAIQQLLVSQRLLPGNETESALFDATVSRQHLRALQPVVVEQRAAVVGLAVSPDSRWLAIGHRDGSLSLRALHDPQAPAQTVMRAHASPAAGDSAPFVRALVFSHDGSLLYSAGADGSLRRWHTQPLAPAGEPMTGHDGPVYGLALSGDGRQLASGGRDGTVRLWDAASGRALGAPIRLAQYPGPVWSVAYRPDDPHQLAVATARRQSGGSMVAMVDPVSMAVRPESYYAHAEDTIHLAFSPRGRFVVTGSRDNNLRVRDLKRPASDPAASVRLSGHQEDVWNVAVSPDGRWVASASADKTVRLWRVGTDDAIGSALVGHSQGVPAVVFSPDGRWLISGSLDGTLRLWPIRQGWKSGAPEWAPPRSAVAAMAMARGGALSVMALRTEAPTLLVRDDDSGAEFELDARPKAMTASLATVTPRVGCRSDGAGEAGPSSLPANSKAPAGSGVPNALAISRDGKRLAAAYADGSLLRWDLASRQSIASPWRPSGCGLISLAWSGDGRRLAAIDEAGHVMLLDEQGSLLPLNPAGQPPARLLPGARVVALADDGRWVAVSGVGSDAADKPWLLAWAAGQTGALRFAGALQADSALAFSADGQWLFSGNRSGKVRLWNARSGQPLSAPLAAHADEVAAIAALPDGAGFVTVARAEYPRVWPARPQSWRQLLCEKLGSNLSRRQWREWVSTQIDYRCPCPGMPIAADDPAAASRPQACPA